MKFKPIDLGEGQVVNIRRAKVREIKSLVTSVSGIVQDVFDILDDSEGASEIQGQIPALVIKNIDFVVETVEKFTKDLTVEQIEDMDVLDLVTILKEMVGFYGIKGDFIKTIFQNYKINLPSKAPIATEEFVEPIPE